MMIPRDQALQLQQFFPLLNDKKFDINTQYKLLKLKLAIEQEQKVYSEQILLNCDVYFEHDNNGNPIINNDGGYKIKPEVRSQCYKVIDQLNKCQVQLPDIQFTLDELQALDLTFGEFAPLVPFVK
ncbi:MAG: hypothetical protein LUC37_04100 [Prevotella sp.]|nr:hypothetical protein [Prevotella sp.]